MFNLPVVPNERAGTWYVAPELRVNEGLKKEHAQSVYFKSTDGHNGKWDFSLKRMNLHILEMTFASGGLVSVDHRIMIVDATRRGKRFPDSLSKTIPIWCSVINNVVYQYQRNENPNIEIEWDLEFHSIPTAVSNSEKEQIKKLIPSFVEKLLNTKTNFKKMQSLVKKPLRPLWIHPSSLILSDGPVWTEKELIDLPFIPIVCVSASISFSQDLNMFQTTPVFPLPNTFNYVQGAADDSETWAPGFTSTHFWLINDQINDAISVQDLEDLIKEKLKTKVNFESPNYGSNHFEWIGKTKIAIGSRHAGNPIRCFENFDFVINCGSEQFEGMGKNYLYLDIPEGKKGQRQFFQNIDIALNAVKNILGKKILIHCMQGNLNFNFRNRSICWNRYCDTFEIYGCR